MWARFTVLRDTPIDSAIAGCVIPSSRSNTIWMRWRCWGCPFQRSAVFKRRISFLVHLTTCSSESNQIRWSVRIILRLTNAIHIRIRCFATINIRFNQLWKRYHRGDVLPREQQWRPRNWRRLLRPRRVGQYDRGRDRDPLDLHLRQYAFAVEDRPLPQRACQFKRASRQAYDVAYHGERVRRLRRPAHQHLHGAERAEAHFRPNFPLSKSIKPWT